MRIIVKLPHAGLGNKLLVWAIGVVFATMHKINPDDMIVYSWLDFHPRRILFLDKDQRLYLNSFKKNDWYQKILSCFYKVSVTDPELIKTYPGNICFSTIPNEKDYFIALRGHETLIKQALFRIATKGILDKYYNAEEYDIAIHIRRGDFCENIRTPLSEVVQIYKLLVNEYGYSPKTYLFTDGTKEEFNELLNFENVRFISGNPALLDMLIMSKAKIIIPSIRSTFSYFASFLSDAHIIRHINDHCGKIRAERKSLFEGKIEIISGQHKLPLELVEKLKIDQ